MSHQKKQGLVEQLRNEADEIDRRGGIGITSSCARKFADELAGRIQQLRERVEAFRDQAYRVGKDAPTDSYERNSALGRMDACDAVLAAIEEILG